MNPTRSPETAAESGILPLPGGTGWLVTGRSAAVRLLTDERLGVPMPGEAPQLLRHRVPADARPLVDDLGEFAERATLPAGPLSHAALRGAFDRFFTVDAVDALVPVMRDAAERLVTRLVENGGGEFMAEVAVPYAAEIGARIVGLSPERFLALHKASRHLTRVAHAADAVRAGHDALLAVQRLIAEARGSAPPESVLDAWNRGETGELSDADVEANVVMLVRASSDKVAGMLGNAAVHLLGTPGALIDPRGRELLLEESLRRDPPLRTVERVVRAPMTLDGVRFEPGQVVSVRIADTDEVTGGAGPVVGSAVLSFGWGVHRCLGARLARRLAHELFAVLGRAAPDTSLVEPHIEQVRHIYVDMPRRLALHCPRAADPGRVAVHAALTEALAEHDLHRPLTSIERVLATIVLRELGYAEPSPDAAPPTIEEWVTWAGRNRG